jgi:hypothetical protein
MDIKPPSVESKTPEGTGEVKPPSAEGEKEQKTESFGLKTEVLPGLTPLPSLEAQPKQSNDLNANTNSATENKNENFGVKLEQPSSVLPPILQGMAANDVTTPSSTGLPGVTPDPEKVKAPGDTGTPPVGTTPSDSVGGVKPPDENRVIPPSIPAIGGAPEAINGVQAQVGWNGGGEVKAQDVQTLDIWEALRNFWEYAKTLNELAVKLRQEQDSTTGSKSDQQKLADAGYSFVVNSITKSETPADVKKSALSSLDYLKNNLSPVEFLLAARELTFTVGLASGSANTTNQTIGQARDRLRDLGQAANNKEVASFASTFAQMKDRRTGLMAGLSKLAQVGAGVSGGLFDQTPLGNLFGAVTGKDGQEQAISPVSRGLMALGVFGGLKIAKGPAMPSKYDRTKSGYIRPDTSSPETNCPYCGKTMDSTIAGTKDSIEWDHLVGLKDAFKSGGQGWAADEWKAFSNDIENLMQVCKSCNASKQDKVLFTEWQPPNMSDKMLQEVQRRITNIKVKYGL